MGGVRRGATARSRVSRRCRRGGVVDRSGKAAARVLPRRTASPRLPLPLTEAGRVLRNLLICGLIAGACAGVLATGFAELAGEPSIGNAISFEARQAKAAGHAPEHELVSR